MLSRSALRSTLALTLALLLAACGSDPAPGTSSTPDATTAADVASGDQSDVLAAVEDAAPDAGAPAGTPDVVADVQPAGPADVTTDTAPDAAPDIPPDVALEADAAPDVVDVAPTPAPPPTPVELAAQVSQAELEATINDLVAFGTRFTSTDGEAQSRDYLVARLQAYGLEVEVDFFSASGYATANLIARKPGTVQPGNVWIFSSHYDSTSNSPTTYAPGADDNASGVAGVLEAARILTPLDLSDSVWFMLTAAEEQGGLGAQRMVEVLDETPDIEVKGVMAPDMIGYWPLGMDDALDLLGDPGSEHLVNDVAAMATTLGVPHKTWIQHYYCYGDDHTYFQEAGYPAFTPMDCVEAHNLPQSGEHTPHYHKTSDTIDTLHMPFMTDVVGVLVGALAQWASPQ